MLVNIMIDKVVLLLLTTLIFAEQTDMTRIVVCLLVAIIVECTSSFLDQKLARGWILACYFIYTLVVPYASIYSPVMIYGLCYEKQYKLAGIGSVAMCLYITKLPYDKGIVLSFILLLAILLENRTHKRYQFEEELKHFRDQSTEITLLLKRQNRALQEKQDYEIYTVTLRERNRIAREIHDNVGHLLSRSILQVGALLATAKEEGVSSHLQGINDTLNKAMNSIRESVHDLHEESISLELTVKEMIGNYPNYDIEFAYEITKELSHSIKYCLIGTMKEALTNIVKHSDATKVVLYLYENQGMIKLKIKDNGTIPVSLTNVKGIGLENMQSRVEGLNGTFIANYVDGFQILVSIPQVGS